MFNVKCMCKYTNLSILICKSRNSEFTKRLRIIFRVDGHKAIDTE